MKPNPLQKYKIQILINKNQLTFNGCLILDCDDNHFIRFSDKFGHILKYNKNVIMSMEETQ